MLLGVEEKWRGEDKRKDEEGEQEGDRKMEMNQYLILDAWIVGPNPKCSLVQLVSEPTLVLHCQMDFRHAMHIIYVSVCLFM